MKRRPLLASVGFGFISTLSGCLSGLENSDSSGSDEYPDRQLRIVSSANEDLTVTLRLVDLEEESVAYEDTSVISFGEKIEVDDALEPGVDYRFEVEIDDENAFEVTIYTYESYKLGITAQEEVEVRTHIEE